MIHPCDRQTDGRTEWRQHIVRQAYAICCRMLKTVQKCHSNDNTAVLPLDPGGDSVPQTLTCAVLKFLLKTRLSVGKYNISLCCCV